SMQLDRRHRRIHALPCASVHIHMRALDSERLGNRKSDPCSRSSYQYNLIGELQVHSVLQESQCQFDSPTVSNDSKRRTVERWTRKVGHIAQRYWDRPPAA